jgi:hypothetical protein
MILQAYRLTNRNVACNSNAPVGRLLAGNSNQGIREPLPLHPRGDPLATDRARCVPHGRRRQNQRVANRQAMTPTADLRSHIDSRHLRHTGQPVVIFAIGVPAAATSPATVTVPSGTTIAFFAVTQLLGAKHEDDRHRNGWRHREATALTVN